MLDHLSGSAPWQGIVSVRKKVAEVRIESSLKGISSSLPEPLNKPAADTLRLVFERKPVEGRIPMDQVSVDLGDVFRLRLMRRQEAGKAVVERGVAALGSPAARMPERGLAFSVDLPRIDLDFWRGLAGNGGGTAGEGGLPLAQIDLRARELLALGRTRRLVLHAEHIELLTASQQELRRRAGELGRPIGGELRFTGSSTGWIGDPALAGSPGLPAVGRLSRLVDLFGPGGADRAKVREALASGCWQTIMGEVKFAAYEGFTNQNKHVMPVIQYQGGKAATVYPPKFAKSKAVYPFPGWK